MKIQNLFYGLFILLLVSCDNNLTESPEEIQFIDWQEFEEVNIRASKFIVEYLQDNHYPILDSDKPDELIIEAINEFFISEGVSELNRRQAIDYIKYELTEKQEDSALQNLSQNQTIFIRELESEFESNHSYQETISNIEKIELKAKESLSTEDLKFVLTASSTAKSQATFSYNFFNNIPNNARTTCVSNWSNVGKKAIAQVLPVEQQHVVLLGFLAL